MPTSRYITAENLILMSQVPKSVRVSGCENSFGHFFAYYYGHYCTDPFADFHYDFFGDVHDLVKGKILECGWFTFRGSAKTSFAKAFLVWCIVYKKYEYINVDSYDKTNAERILFDIVVEMQTNRKLIADFGQMFNEERRMDVKTQKRIGDFMTSNGVRVEAHSTQEPVRGRESHNIRPQLLLVDDFEVMKTVRSEAMTEQISDHISEARPGMDAKKRAILWLGNYISEYGNVQKIIDKGDIDEKVRVRIIPIYVEEDGKEIPTWEQRWCMTDDEAGDTGKASIESEKRGMWKPDTGNQDWMREMMCDPKAGTGGVFSRDMFRKATMEDIRGKAVRIVFTVDPGGAGDMDDLSRKDPAGFTVAFITKDDEWYLMSYERRVGASALIDEIFRMMEWLEGIGMSCTDFGWEKNMYTNALYPTLKRKMREKTRRFPVYEIKHGGRAKEARIKGSLLNRYETGTVYHIDGECADLEDQLLRLPGAKHDDVMDSAAMVNDIVTGKAEKPRFGVVVHPRKRR